MRIPSTAGAQDAERNRFYLAAGIAAEIAIIGRNILVVRMTCAADRSGAMQLRAGFLARHRARRDAQFLTRALAAAAAVILAAACRVCRDRMRTR